MYKKIIKIFCFLILAFTLVACEKEIVEVKTYEIRFDTNGGSEVQKQTVKENEMAQKPIDPTKDGSEFIEWTFNGKSFDFKMPVNQNMTLKATWKYIKDELSQDELKEKIDLFNESLIDKDYDVEVSFSGKNNSSSWLFQLRNDSLSLATFISETSSDTHYVLQKNDKNNYDIFQGVYNYQNYEMIAVENFKQEFSLLNVHELSTINENFGLFKKDNAYNKTYSYNLKWDDFNYSQLLVMESLFGSYFNTLNIENIKSTEDVNITFNIGDSVEIIIAFNEYTYRAVYMLDTSDYTVNIDNIYQKGVLDKNDAIMPLVEGVEVNEDIFVNYTTPYYYLVNLKAGYYDFKYIPSDFEFESLDGKLLDLIVELDFIESNQRRLIYLEEDMMFYVKVYVPVSMYSREIVLKFTSYDYSPKASITMNDYLELEGLNGGYYDPIVIEIDFEYDVYEVYSSHFFSSQNIKVRSFGFESGESVHYIYKGDEDKVSKLIIDDENVNIIIKGINIENSIETTKENPYYVTSGNSDSFMLVPGFDEHYLTLEVPKEAVYQLVLSGGAKLTYATINGEMTDENGLTKYIRLKEGTYNITFSTFYIAYVNIKYNVYYDREIEASLDESYINNVHGYTKTSYSLELLEDSAFSFIFDYEASYDLNLSITLPNGNKYPLDTNHIKYLYLPKGKYLFTLDLTNESYSIHFETKKIDKPEHDNYSFDFKEVEYSKQINFEENIFGYFISIDKRDDQYYYIKGNMDINSVDYFGYDKVSKSEDYVIYYLSDNLLYISGIKSGNLTFFME